MIGNELNKLIDKWERSALGLNEADRLIRLLIMDKRKVEKVLEEEVIKLNYSEEKATELALDIAEVLGFNVGEHTDVNNPVQNAIDGISEKGTQIEKWKSI